MTYNNSITRETGAPKTGWLRIKARYGTTCIVCERPVEPGRFIRWNPGRRGGTARHDHCRLYGET